jgi:hypothetical protein
MDVELSSLVHAYGIVPFEAPIDLPTTGLGGSGLALLDAGPVSAVFSIVPATAYGDAAWQAHGDDPRWLTEVATEHQRVLSDVVRDTDVLPLRLPAMYRDETHLHEMLTAEGPLLRAALDAVHNHVEWAVHLYFTGERDEPTSRPASGVDFFRQKAEAARSRDRARAAREQQVRDAYGDLADVSRQSVANPPQDSALSGRREPMLLNSAHLVCRSHERSFLARVEEVAERLAPAGLIVEVSGPWPPYNFVELGVDERLDAAT